MSDSQPKYDPYLSRFKHIETFVFDMDGVLTDGSVLVSESDYENGQYNWFRKMHVRDGFALQLAAKMNYNIIILSGSGSGPVGARLKKLGIQYVFFDIKNKAEYLTEFFKSQSLSFDTTLYMGDDIPDLYAMKLCYLATCPLDAVSEIKSIAQYVSPFKGGEGCVRDVISKVMKLQGKWIQQSEVTST